MKITSKLASAIAFAALAACGGTNAANNDMNATDMNAGMTDLNATDMNATNDMNATGNLDMNATGTGNAATNSGNTTTNTY